LHYRARYYNPALQRVISEDPIGLKGGINFYSYVKNSPLRFNDAEGLGGCGPGSGIGDWLVPDYPYGNNFTKCCDEHDDCYGCKGKKEGKTKADCDLQFCKCLVNKCLFSFPSMISCPSLEYCLAVIFGGGSAFHSGRKCCP
jgi:hypothetical protein